MDKITNVYLDFASTTPISGEVYREMLSAINDNFGNAESLYAQGRQAKQTLEDARAKIAKAIGASASEIYFTSGSTEGNNWALKGIARANRSKGNHIITSMVEHPSVLKACHALEKEGFEVTYLPVDNFGVVDYTELVKAIRPETILISIQSANGDVGTIQPIRAIAELAKLNEIPFHTDATYAIGALPCNVHEMNISALTLTGHKIFAPKGVGVLYVKKGIKIADILSGEPVADVPSIAALSKAVTIVTENLDENNKRLKALRKYFLKQLSEKVHNITLNGHPTQRLLSNINISFEGAEGESVVYALDKLGVSAATCSACASDELKACPSLAACGLEQDIVQNSVRFSISPDTTQEEIDFAIGAIYKAVKKVRSVSAVRIYKNKVEL